MKKIALFIVSVVCLIACKKEPVENKVATTDWLIGKWENKSIEGKLSENWVKVNDSLLTGTAFVVKEKDTLHSEKMQLKNEAEGVFYVSTIIGQHNNKPVRFKLTTESSKQLVFENKNNDFPKKIIYTRITNDSLVINISGIQQGKNSSESYPMKRE